MNNTKIWALSILGLIGGWLLYVAAPSLMPVLLALVLAYFIHPLVLWLQERVPRRKKPIAIVIAMALIVAFFIFLVNIILPTVINQTIIFVREFSGYSQRFMDIADQLIAYLYNLGLDSRITGSLDDAFGQLFSVVTNTIMGFVSSVFGYIFKLTDLIIITILLFYFLLDGPLMVKYIIDSMPDTLRAATQNFFAGLNRIIWGYMRNQIVISLITGIVSGLAFIIIRLPYARLLGIIAGVLNMIPYFGSIIGGVIAVLVALLYYDLKRALITLAVVLVIQQVLGNIITPRLQGKTLGIHPVVVITSLLVCNHLWGTLGMFVAVPLVGMAQLFLKELLPVISRLK